MPLNVPSMLAYWVEWLNALLVVD